MTMRNSSLVRKRVRLDNEIKFEYQPAPRRRKRDIQRKSNSVPQKKSVKKNASQKEPLSDHFESDIIDESLPSSSSKPPEIARKMVNITLDNETFADKDDVLMYQNYLKKNNAMVPASEDFTAFFLQDWSNQSPKDKYLILRRKQVFTQRSEKWIYYCSCDHSRSLVVESMGKNVEDHDFEGFEQKYKSCFHIKAAQPILTGFDLNQETSDEDKQDFTAGDHQYVKEEVNTPFSPEVYTIQTDSSVVCVRSSTDEYSIVRVDYSSKKVHLKCCSYSCRYLKEKCLHIKNVETKLDSPELSKFELALKRKPTVRSNYVHYSISNKVLSFTNKNKKKTTPNNFKACPDPQGFCECGKNWSSEVDFYETMKAFLWEDVITVHVYTRPCSSCKEVKMYDGADDGLLNMVSYMVSHDVLYGFLKQFLTEGTTVNSFYKEWNWRQIENHNEDFSALLSYTRFLHAWYCFLRLIDIDYRYAFSCPKCGDVPDNVVMDGVALGVKKSMLKWKTFVETDNVKDECLIGR